LIPVKACLGGWYRRQVPETSDQIVEESHGDQALGQTLIVTSGLGWVQRWAGPKEEIRPGDVIWFPPGEKHWHGAAAMTAMTHIAIVEQLNGKSADWMEKVSDDQYRA
jgi:quercetin dioxygenase-like cupin family protein